MSNNNSAIASLNNNARLRNSSLPNNLISSSNKNYNNNNSATNNSNNSNTTPTNLSKHKNRKKEFFEKSSSLSSSFASSSTASLGNKGQPRHHSLQSSNHIANIIETSDDSALSSSSSAASAKQAKDLKRAVENTSRTSKRPKQKDIKANISNGNELKKKLPSASVDLTDYFAALNHEYDEIKQQFLTLNTQSLNYRRLLENSPLDLATNPKDPRYHFNLKDDESDRIRDSLLKLNNVDKLSKMWNNPINKDDIGTWLNKPSNNLPPLQNENK
jgi:hypothetical protein